MELDGLNALIINPNIGSRARLREVLKNAIYKVRLSWLNEMRETKGKEEAFSKYDVIIISSSVGEDEVKNFLSKVRNSPKGSTSCFVVTLDGVHSAMLNKVSTLYLDGIEGFITEPYSPDELIKLLSIIKQKKEKQSLLDKQRKAMHFLLDEAIRLIDLFIKCIEANRSPHQSIYREAKNLRKAAEALHQHNPQLYETILIEVFESIEPRCI